VFSLIALLILCLCPVFLRLERSDKRVHEHRDTRAGNKPLMGRQRRVRQHPAQPINNRVWPSIRRTSSSSAAELWAVRPVARFRDDGTTCRWSERFPRLAC
jgi:hypothetical protein